AVDVAGDDIDLVFAGVEEVAHEHVAEGAEAVVPADDGAGEGDVAAQAGGDELVVHGLELLDVFGAVLDLVVDVDVGFVADLPDLVGQVEGRRFVSIDEIRHVGGDALGGGHGAAGGVGVDVEVHVFGVDGGVAAVAVGAVDIVDRLEEDGRGAGVEELGDAVVEVGEGDGRSEEHTSELQS